MDPSKLIKKSPSFWLGIFVGLLMTTLIGKQLGDGTHWIPITLGWFFGTAICMYVWEWRQPNFAHSFCGIQTILSFGAMFGTQDKIWNAALWISLAGILVVAYLSWWHPDLDREEEGSEKEGDSKTSLLVGYKDGENSEGRRHPV